MKCLLVVTMAIPQQLSLHLSHQLIYNNLSYVYITKYTVTPKYISSRTKMSLYVP